MNILFMAWRDKSNPTMGGAEISRHEIAKYLVAKGHRVTLLTSRFPGSAAREEKDGYIIIRTTGIHTVYFTAAWYYIRHLRGKFDFIIDEMNGIPFFTPLYTRTKKALYVHHVVGDVWFHEFLWPFAFILKLAEKIFLRLYSKENIITVSESTEADLRANGLKHVHKIMNGISTSPLKKVPPKKVDHFVFVGRLKPAKQVEHAIKAMELYVRKYPRATLDVIGTGDPAYVSRVKKLPLELGIEKNIHFHGFLPNSERDKLVSQAMAIIVPSEREGWGLIVVEANAMGTPAIGYDTVGLRESILDKKTGYLARRNDVSDIFVQMKKIRTTFPSLAGNALEYSRKFTWQRMAGEMEKIILQLSKNGSPVKSA